jgi:predicted NodU family carbamoyl transferase
MNILGISAYYHDSAAALIRSGEIVAAAQRFTRKKPDPGFLTRAIRACLEIGQVSLPNAFISLDESLSQIMNPLWQSPQLNGDNNINPLAKVQDGLSENPQMVDMIDTHGSSFWIEMK